MPYNVLGISSDHTLSGHICNEKHLISRLNLFLSFEYYKHILIDLQKDIILRKLKIDMILLNAMNAVI